MNKKMRKKKPQFEHTINHNLFKKKMFKGLEKCMFIVEKPVRKYIR